jgi:hypothetical protein
MTRKKEVSPQAATLNTPLFFIHQKTDKPATIFL